MAAGATLPATDLPRTAVVGRWLGVPANGPSRTRPSAPAQVGLLLSGVSAAYLLRHPERYDDIADIGAFPHVDWLTREVVRPLKTPFTLLIASDLAVALFLLGKGVAVRLGLAAAVVFHFAVILAVDAYGLVNLPAVSVQVQLRSTFDHSALELLHTGRGLVAMDSVRKERG